MKPRAITGVGVASTFGVGRQAFLEGMRAGKPGQPSEGKLEVPSFDPTKYLGDKGLRSLDRLTKMLVVSTRLALHDAGLKQGGAWAAFRGDEVGIIVSNAYGSLEAIAELHKVATLEDARYINPSRFPLTVANSAAGYASIWEDLRALNVSVCDGNCGALDAVACADAMLEQRRAKAILVGGAEAMSEPLQVAFQKLGASGEATTLGEGAAIMALEPLQDAVARGADVAALAVGYGTYFSPPESEAVLLHPASDALEHAIAGALSDAGAQPGDVDVVVSGVSGLRAFDEAELVGIGRALGDPWIVAPKQALGETLGASGALGMLAAMSILRDGATAYGVRGSVRTRPRTALVTTLGYYGNASALVMQAHSR
jgi:3-oxoacyl-[acyl-carrier-protein] synthase II